MCETVKYASVGVTGRGGTHADCVTGFDNAELVAGADVVEDRPPVIGAEEGRKTAEVVLAAYASAEIGREVRIDELRELEEYSR